ncbi:MAG: RIP metalloprotease RseP [Pseudomonadota bacterium]
MITVLAFLFVIGLVVVIHELGHYLIARREGIAVEVFSVGFGPEIIARTAKDGTRWRLSAIPLGGYVRFAGEMVASPDEPAQQSEQVSSDPHAGQRFSDKSVRARAAVVIAGPLANVLLTVVLLAGLYMTGSHPMPLAVIDEVLEGSPAAEAGLRSGDRVVRIDGHEISVFVELARAVRTSEGRPLVFEVVRDDQPQDVLVTPMESSDGYWQIGITATHGAVPPLRAIWGATQETYGILAATFAALSDMIVAERSAGELLGPVGIAQVSGAVAQQGFSHLIWLAAVISINLAFINILPIPMLDGGHLVFYLVEALRGRPVSPKWQEYASRLGVAMLVLLLVFVTFNDLSRWLMP